MREVGRRGMGIAEAGEGGTQETGGACKSV